MLYKNLIRLWIISSLFFNSLNAEEKTFFTCAKFNAVDTSNLYYNKGKEYIKLELPQTVRSKIYPVTLGENRKLVFFSLSKDEKDQDVYTPVARAHFPEKTNQVLVLFAKSKKVKKSKYRLLVIDDSLEVFPVGSFRFFNFTKEPLLVSFHKTKKVVKPRSETLIKLKISSNGQFIPFILKNKKGDIYYETKLIGQQINRDMVFIKNVISNTYKVKLKFLSETIPVSSLTNEQPSN